MKRLLGALTILIILGVMYFSRSHDSKTQTSASRMVELPQVEATKSTPTPVAKATQQSKPLTEEEKWAIDEEDRERCWSKIDLQAEPMSTYLSYLMRSMSPIVGDWFFRERDDVQSEIDENTETSTSGLFFLGLQKAHWLMGHNQSEKNDNVALTILSEVVERDPTNAAPLVYLAALQEKMGRHEDSLQTLEKLKNAKVYNSYLGDVIKEISRSIHTPSDLWNARKLYSRMPISDTNAISKFIVKKKLSNVAELMASEFLANPLDDPKVGTVLVEQLVGVSFLHQIDPSRNDLPTLENRRSYMRKYIASELGNMENVDFDPRKSGCSIELFRDEVEKLEAARAEEPRR